MRPILFVILFFMTLSIFSQDGSCAFSDGNFHYQFQLDTSDPLPADFDKNDFIVYMESNSNISGADSAFLNDHIIDLFKKYPNGQVNQFQDIIYVISDDDSLQTLLGTFSDVIVSSFLFCNCRNMEGYYFTYATLEIENVPANGFNKNDFIEHLQLNSNISAEDSDFLNASIIEVHRSFPSSQNENLKRTVSIFSTYDLLSLFLYNFPESIALTELVCDNIILAIAENEPNEVIQIIPNPITESSHIYLNSSRFGNLSIFDVTGKLITTINVKNKKLVELGQFNLEKGFYILKFSNENGASRTKKIIVN